MQITEKDFNDFRERYTSFVRAHQQEFLQAFTGRFKDLKDSYRLVESEVQRAKSKEAGAFNIFAILGMAHKEVETHTPFLRELLDPKGSHEQGGLFLKLFLRQGLQQEETLESDWSVIREQGHIDLRIVNYKLTTAIFIENKVYSDAHDGQLSRYYEEWKDGYFKGNGKFVYLSIHGRDPGDGGFDEHAKYGKEAILADLTRWSYKTHIVNWLEEVVSEIEALNVREAVHQYMGIIKQL